MNDHIIYPAVQKAFDHIKGNLQKEIWPQGTRLPSTRSLAADIGVAQNSVLKAIAQLKSAGLVHSTQRTRIRAGDKPATLPVSSIHEGHIWLKKRKVMEQEILSGVFANRQFLPSLKELQSRYGVCFRTMRAILGSMVADGVVRIQGKRYELLDYASHSFKERIVLVTYDSPNVQQSAINQGQYCIPDLLEQECLRRQLIFDIVKIDFYNSNETRRAITSPAFNAPALGYVLDLWQYSSEEFQRSYLSALSRLAAFKKPVTILDEFGSFVLPDQFTSNPLIQVFRIEGRKAGGRMARMLLSMGHRSMVFISASNDYSWSRQRFEGIAEQYSAAGLGANVFQVTPGEGIEHTHMHTFAMSGFGDELIRNAWGMRYSADMAREYFREFSEFRINFSMDHLNPADVKQVRKEMAIIRSLVDQKPRKSLFVRIFDDVMNEVGTYMMLKLPSRLFEPALKYKDATAWVCASDFLAFRALEFLHSRGIRVPQDISVAGFDNRPAEALERQLTTFDFNAPGFIHRMLNFIIRPPKSRGPYRHSGIEVEGMVMQRDTTAAPH